MEGNLVTTDSNIKTIREWAGRCDDWYYPDRSTEIPEHLTEEGESLAWALLRETGLPPEFLAVLMFARRLENPGTPRPADPGEPWLEPFRRLTFSRSHWGPSPPSRPPSASACLLSMRLFRYLSWHTGNQTGPLSLVQVSPGFALIGSDHGVAMPPLSCHKDSKGK